MASPTKASRGGPVDSSAEDKQTQAAIEAIDDVQNEIDKLNEQASEEILRVEQSYNKLRQPHYQQRSQHIANIPKFWLTTFSNHPQLCLLISPEEEELLGRLTQLEVQDLEAGGYKISFHFAENSYFSNKVLVREFHLPHHHDHSAEGDAGHAHTTAGSTATKIDWLPGKDLTSKSKNGSSAGQKRQPSSGAFFDWFGSTNDPSSDEFAEIIKDEIWPNPLQFFLSSGEDDEDEDAEGFNDGEEEACEEEEEEGDE